MHGFGEMSGLFLLAAAATLHPPPPCEVMSIIDKDTIIANDIKASMVLGVATVGLPLENGVKSTVLTVAIGVMSSSGWSRSLWCKVYCQRLMMPLTLILLRCNNAVTVTGDVC